MPTLIFGNLLAMLLEMGSTIVLITNAFNGKVVLDGSFAIGMIEN
jgi:hypothetical protein